MNRKDLINYRNNEEWIKGRIEYIDNYKDTVNKLTATLSDMPKGSPQVQDQMAEKLAKIMDFTTELMDYIITMQDKQKQVLDALNRLENINTTYRNILDKVYILGKTLETVASEEHYSYVHICRLHGEALNKFDQC